MSAGSPSLSSAPVLVDDPRSSPPMTPATVDVPLGSLATHGLLELCPPGYLPSCVVRQLIYSSSSSWASANSPRNLAAASVTALPPYPIGTRLRFHFRTTITSTGTLLDDSHHGVRSKPMELVTGKRFILEIWEVALNTMKEDEVFRFQVPKEMCLQYPAVARVKRELAKTRAKDQLTLTNYFEAATPTQGVIENETPATEVRTGYQDLDDYLKMPQSLTFTLELLEVSLPGEYNIGLLYNEPFQPLIGLQQPVEINFPETNDSVTSVERKADKLLVSRDYQGAATKYSEALIKFDQLIINVETDDDQQKKRISLLMKAAYCKMNSKEFTESLELLTSVLEINPDNPVALFRRGRCNVQTKRYDQARKDFSRALELDPTYQKAVKPELALIDVEERQLN